MRVIPDRIFPDSGEALNFIGSILMLSGGGIALAALVLLASLAQRFTFISAGLLVELLGLALIARHYRIPQKGRR
jgi:hypothetical protein